MQKLAPVHAEKDPKQDSNRLPFSWLPFSWLPALTSKCTAFDSGHLQPLLLKCLAVQFNTEITK